MTPEIIYTTDLQPNHYVFRWKKIMYTNKNTEIRESETVENVGASSVRFNTLSRIALCIGFNLDRPRNPVEKLLLLGANPRIK